MIIRSNDCLKLSSTAIKGEFMRTIKKIHPESMANFYAYFLIICAILTSFFIAFANITQRILEGTYSFIDILLIIIVNMLGGVLVALIGSVAAFVIGFISGFLFASLYNTAVKIGFLKGIKIDLE